MTPYVWREESCARPAGFTRDESWNTDLYISVGHEMMKAFKDGKI